MKCEGNAIYIRFLEDQDVKAVTELQLRNQTFFDQYVSTRTSEFYTIKYQAQLIQDNVLQRERDEKYTFGIFVKDTDMLIGSITLSEVLRGPLQNCFIGYYLDLEHNGKGFMTEAVALVLRYAFDILHLHRIEAGVMPHNKGSIRVLEKAGFQKEGIARKNVNIKGNWEDHQVLAIISEDLEGRSL
ncbi:MAG: RimJ/RimL family protein N-acetyltransferase [Firmicutes bacterium HGW-Firmicutes-7]|nr:MAG: RimJ/RimL family protein N-acetyltransferase [Firmicutes bacterium HGW-Firmicutes-7]